MRYKMSDKLQLGEGQLTLIRPAVEKDEAIHLACSLYGLKLSDPSLIKEFDSYDDRNFYLKGTLPPKDHAHERFRQNEAEFVLKILNHVDSQDISSVQGQNEALLFLKENGFKSPAPIKALNGEYAVTCEIKCGNAEKGEENKQLERVHVVRLLSFVPGKLIRDVPCTAEVFFSLGRYTAKMNKVLQGFSHPGVGSLAKKEWDLSQIHTIKSYVLTVSQGDREQQILSLIYNNFTNDVLPQLQNFSKQAIHGDVNYENILVEPNHCGEGYEVVSFIDFGDMSVSYRLFEVAICMMYMILLGVRQGHSHDEAIQMAGHVLCGYQSVWSLSQSELPLLYWSVAARFFQSFVNGVYKQSLEPENAHISDDCELIMGILQSYTTLTREEVLNSWLSLAK
ncbi:hydroxylysine kinase-like [Stylophora pistillata]|uniref:Hydroxylysine kinase n=1 Tax=Stylophora pistillata TaxID=50429 RepID=A0A2B4SYQ3_STYPI|nr:hydroxylysine kinase-like [Stylophora pistillata]PFX33702.1 Hydroxylysine kinase [Stylophora pistillata]